MIPEEVQREHMAICKNCKERERVKRLVDFHVDWIDCFWDCPNDIRSGGIEIVDQLNMLGYEAEWQITLDNDEEMITCSACQCRMIKREYDNAVGDHGYRFCPYCGKRMAPYRWRYDPWRREYKTV